jgi:hypothetical protein
MSTLTLAERILEIESALTAIRHAFGGALALAYYADPRATIDIDLNVFVPVEQFAEVAAPLIRLGVSADDPRVAELVARHGQARAMWDATPIDLFFSYDRFHQTARRGAHVVPFGTGSIPVLAADHLIVCKVVFNRPKDWVDIQSVIDAGTDVDPAEILRWVARIAGDEDPRYDRIVRLLLCA